MAEFPMDPQQSKSLIQASHVACRAGAFCSEFLHERDVEPRNGCANQYFAKHRFDVDGFVMQAAYA